eukprot:GHVN01064882.1.p1 GENE.GHVN01064882.1~~GHVN01064882.1.p1  ORF type:complete len:240 (-),score=10.01 GHVN01064882.1:160-879(-)
MTIGSTSYSSYFIGDLSLDSVNKVRDLGVFYSSDLKFNYHMATIINRANRRIALFKQVFRSRDKAVIVRYHQLYIRPLLEYCLSVWWGVCNGEQQRIEGVQRRFLRLIRGFDVLSYEQRLLSCGLSSLSDRSRQYDAVQTFKGINNNFTAATQKEYASSSHNHQLRSTSLEALRVPYARLVDMQRFFSVRGAKRWNSIPKEVRDSPSDDVLKRKLRKHLACTSHDEFFVWCVFMSFSLH